MAPSIRRLSPRLQEVACRDLNEDPNRREQDLAHIKEWLKKQPHLKTARQDDQWLLTFLRGCKFSLERTKEKLDTYYTMRTLLPEFFSNRDPMLPEIQELLKLGIHIPLLTRDELGRRIVLMRQGPTDPAKHKIADQLKVALMVTDILMLEDDGFIIDGEIALFDFDHIKLGHFAEITPTLAKKLMTCWQDGYPNRPKAIYYINCPRFIQTFVVLFRSMMKEKIKKRFFGYTDVSSLSQNIPLKLLPTEYGGESASVEEMTAYWKQKVESYRDWFLEDGMRKSDEKMRPGKPKTSEAMFGVEGSFRQLSVD